MSSSQAMARIPSARARFLAGRSQQPLVPNAQFGMIMFILTELMFFLALISAYLVIKASSLSQWAPPVGAMLPKPVTLVNTLVLLASGGFMFAAARRMQALSSARSSEPAWSDARLRAYLGQALLLGFVFVGVQGFEWVRLFAQGMSMTSGIFGACFYLLVGSHGMHAFCGALGMLYGMYRLRRGDLDANGLWSIQIFWTFVVGVWPVLFYLAYSP